MDNQVADTLLNALIDGRYRIRGRVARGGMATVYTATDERLDRTVAIKIIHPHQANSARVQVAEFLARFTDEAKTIARLTHPNVVAVYDQGTYNGVPYLVMEYVRGRTLRDILTERGRLNPSEALAIMEQMLAAIAAAHRAGLVHRDVKPENVLVAEAPSGGRTNLVDSVVKVADFGLARAVEASSETDGANQLMATVAYVAPELVTEGRADPRTDVYSAGIVLFEMLTGRVPYDAERALDVAWQHVDRDVPRPSTLVPGLPPVLDDLVVRATRRDPGARPTDAGALQAEVQVVRDDLGTMANASTTVLRPVPTPLEQPTMVVQQPTMVVSTVPPAERPSWARLPEQPRERSTPHRRRAAPPRDGAAGRLADLRERLLADRTSRVAVGAAVLALILVIAGVGWWFGAGRYTSTPNLINLAGTEAQARAERAGFEVAFTAPRYSNEVAKDAVLAQDPTSDERIVRGGTITLTLSLGPERFPVPDVVGKTLDLAQLDLEEAGLKVKRGPDRYDDNLEKGVVVAVDPEVGTEVKPGDTITVIVSKGKAPITVPVLIGKSLAEARTALQQLNLEIVVEYKESDRPKDEVLAQNPPDGAGVEPGAKVTVEVSEGPPLVTVPSVMNLPCPQARQILEGAGLTVGGLHINPNGPVRSQNPAPNTQVPPRTQVAITCF
ncbi:Stk1 family PASTA domain-containing Ser/Thr kinase [Micromonospora sp. HM5-17]|jgi:serine/threonine-protein kinase|uniref:Stk1 family PASTA domain-containing Ser/Thr kinase n=1 Tax=Micromonospora sp. HM5-17 TaxID=2487710 RepID=UPI000F4888E9|nr:Stk1 family PASTA domain-containing Ser/Thr kinase [Micromonospora sp. HM5-17]ROT31267.1 Stk1 family PASTA domain-containing Ser/Thr kinase [Micromonospora sp. HM5-17]